MAKTKKLKGPRRTKAMRKASAAKALATKMSKKNATAVANVVAPARPSTPPMNLPAGPPPPFNERRPRAQIARNRTGAAARADLANMRFTYTKVGCAIRNKRKKDHDARRAKRYWKERPRYGVSKKTVRKCSEHYFARTYPNQAGRRRKAKYLVARRSRE